MLYVHDTLQLFGSALDHLHSLWLNEIRPYAGSAVAGRITRFRKEQYGAVTDVIRTAALIPQRRAITPESLQAVCEAGLAEVFGPD